MTFLTVTQPTVFKRTTAQSSTLAARDKWVVEPGAPLSIKHAFPVGNHCLVHLDTPLGSVGQVGYFYRPHVRADLREIRGVWLTNVDSDILDSRETLQRGLQHLKALGFNTVYPAVWQRGYTLYPSPVAARVLGHAITPDPRFNGRDMLAEVIEEAQRLDLRVIPWFEYGLMTPPGSPLDLRYDSWIMVDQQGKKIRIKTADRQPDFNVWMNPSHPDVQQFMVDLVVDVVQRYAIDGIQLDDHFGWPVELGYDPFTQSRYRSDNGGRSLPTELTHRDRLRWAANQVDRLLLQVVTAVKQQQPGCQISISPNPLGFSKANYLADWSVWYGAGLVDELALQLYRSTLVSFLMELNKPEVRSLRDRLPVSIGILTGLKQQSVSSRWIEQQISVVRGNGFAGVVFFFYETLLYEKLSPTRIARTPDDLALMFT